MAVGMEGRVGEREGGRVWGEGRELMKDFSVSTEGGIRM